MKNYIEYVNDFDIWDFYFCQIPHYETPDKHRNTY